MGECGCAKFDPDFHFPAPSGGVYLISIRPPCGECDTPMGILIECCRDGDEFLRLAHVPLLPFVPYAKRVECAIPLIAPFPLREQLMGEALKTEDLIDGDVANALADAMRRTRERWDEEVAKAQRTRTRRKTKIVKGGNRVRTTSGSPQPPPRKP